MSSDTDKPRDADSGAPEDSEETSAAERDAPDADSPDADSSDADSSDADDPEASGTVVDEEAGPTGPGAMLRDAREARRLELREVADSLNLTKQVVAALEADDYATLPGSAFVRGYLRAYARLLKLSVDEVLDAHREFVGDLTEPQIRPATSLGSARADDTFVHRHTGLAMTLTTVAVLAVVGALVYFAWLRDAGPEPAVDAVSEEPAVPPSRASRPENARAPEPTPDEGAARTSTGEMGADDRAPDAGSPEVVDPSLGNPEAGDPEAGEPDPDRSRVDEQPRAESADAAQPGVDPVGLVRDELPGGEGVRIFAGGDDHLHFVFSEDCWVEVRDGEGVDIYSDLSSGGEVLDIWGRAPFSILLGYAPGVELVYNDQRIALRPFTRNDVANLVLGR